LPSALSALVRASSAIVAEAAMPRARALGEALFEDVFEGALDSTPLI